MEPKSTTRLPCAPRGQNAQAHQVAPVTVARKRVVPKGEVRASERAAPSPPEQPHGAERRPESHHEIAYARQDGLL
jgi:hypothetical protein